MLSIKYVKALFLQISESEVLENKLSVGYPQHARMLTQDLLLLANGDFTNCWLNCLLLGVEFPVLELS